MRILHINVDWNQGGPGTIGKDICDVIKEEGHECYVVYGRLSDVSDVNSCQIDTRLEVVTHALLSRLLCNEGAYSKRATKKLIEILKQYNPDIVHLHTLLGHYINHKLLFDYLRNNNICTVWTIHDCSPFTGHCINFDRVKCDKWKELCQECPLKHDYPYSYFFDRSKETYLFRKNLYGDMKNLHLVVPSYWMRDIIGESFLKNLDINVINNGINLDKFGPRVNDIKKQYHIENKTLLLAATYNWNEMKGWKLLLEIAELLDSSYAFVVIGNKNEKEVTDKIISIPVITNQDELIEWYSAADLFINPTLGDNYPTVNIEALACGTPIITCNTGGSPEIAGNTCGRVVYSNSAEEFIERIKECEDAQITREQCCAQAKRFDRKNVYQKYIELYMQITRNKGN